MAKSTADMAQLAGNGCGLAGRIEGVAAHWCDCLDKFYLRVACNLSFRLAKGGNKDQLCFSPKENKLYGGKKWCSLEKEVIRWL